MIISTLVCAARQAISQLPESVSQEASEVVRDMLITSTAEGESMAPAPAVSVLQVRVRKARTNFGWGGIGPPPETLAVVAIFLAGYLPGTIADSNLRNLHASPMYASKRR